MKKKLLSEIRGLLAFHQYIGMETYPRTPGIDTFLGRIRTKKTAVEPTKDLASGKTTLEEIRSEISGCCRCKLHESRSNIVFGQGNARAELLIIGEWPSKEDDSSSCPFSGETGKLLDRMLAAIDMDRDKVFITSMVKCSPPEGKQPQPEDISACRPYLISQIECISPRLICAMGTLAAQALTNSKQSLLRLRGRMHRFKEVPGQEIPLLPTLHPAFLLTNPEMKKASWADLQKIQKYLRQNK